MNLKKLGEMEKDEERFSWFKEEYLNGLIIRIYFINETKKSHVSIGEMLRQLRGYDKSKVKKWLFHEFSIIKTQYLSEKNYDWQVACRYYVSGYSFRFLHESTYDNYLADVKHLIAIMLNISKVKPESIEFDFFKRHW